MVTRVERIHYYVTNANLPAQTPVGLHLWDYLRVTSSKALFPRRIENGGIQRQGALNTAINNRVLCRNDIDLEGYWIKYRKQAYCVN